MGIIMNVNEIMTAKVITIGMDDTLGQIQKLFGKHKFHHVLIVEDEELIGIISDRDVLKEISPYINTLSEDSRARKTLTKKAHQIMARNPITVEPDSFSHFVDPPLSPFQVELFDQELYRFFELYL